MVLLTEASRNLFTRPPEEHYPSFEALQTDASGFIPAVPTINTDEHGTNAMGNTRPALFRSDRDMFSFFMSDKSPPDDGLGGMLKGVFVWNSEVGYKSFGFSTFYLRAVCGNLLIHDATNIKSRRSRHTGRVKHVVREFHEDLVRISAEITTAEYDVFQQAKETRFVPHSTDEHADVIKRLRTEFKVSEADAREIVELAYLEENPGDVSVWGIVNGITSSAKAHRYAEDRTRVGALAGRVLSAAQ